MEQTLIYGRLTDVSNVVTWIRHMKSIAAMIFRVAKRLPIAQKVILESELRFFRAEREKGLGEEIILDVHKVSCGMLAILIGNLCALSAEVEGTDRSSFRVMKRWGDARLL